MDWPARKCWSRGVSRESQVEYLILMSQIIAFDAGLRAASPDSNA